MLNINKYCFNAVKHWSYTNFTNSKGSRNRKNKYTCALLFYSGTVNTYMCVYTISQSLQHSLIFTSIIKNNTHKQSVGTFILQLKFRTKTVNLFDQSATSTSLLPPSFVKLTVIYIYYTHTFSYFTYIYIYIYVQSCINSERSKTRRNRLMDRWATRTPCFTRGQKGSLTIQGPLSG